MELYYVQEVHDSDDKLKKLRGTGSLMGTGWRSWIYTW